MIKDLDQTTTLRELFQHETDVAADNIRLLTHPEDTRYLLRGTNNIDRLAATVAVAQHTHGRIPVALFWGPHTARKEINARDRKTAGALFRAFNEGLSVTPEFQVILADTHGDFNGIDNTTYLQEVRDMVEGEGLGQAHWLSDLYDQHGVSIGEHLHGEAPISDELRSVLTQSAERTEGRGNPDAYANMRLQEADIIRQLATSRGIFTVIGDPVSTPLFPPDVPILFTRASAKSGDRFLNMAPWIGNGAPQ